MTGLLRGWRERLAAIARASEAQSESLAALIAALRQAPASELDGAAVVVVPSHSEQRHLARLRALGVVPPVEVQVIDDLDGLERLLAHLARAQSAPLVVFAAPVFAQFHADLAARAGELRLVVA